MKIFLWIFLYLIAMLILLQAAKWADRNNIWGLYDDTATEQSPVVSDLPESGTADDMDPNCKPC